MLTAQVFISGSTASKAFEQGKTWFFVLHSVNLHSLMQQG